MQLRKQTLELSIFPKKKKKNSKILGKLTLMIIQTSTNQIAPSINHSPPIYKYY